MRKAKTDSDWWMVVGANCPLAITASARETK